MFSRRSVLDCCDDFVATTTPAYFDYWIGALVLLALLAVLAADLWLGLGNCAMGTFILVAWRWQLDGASELEEVGSLRTGGHRWAVPTAKVTPR